MQPNYLCPRDAAGEGSKLCVPGSRRVCQRFHFPCSSAPLCYAERTKKCVVPALHDETFYHHLGIWPFTGLIIPKSKRPRKCPFGHKMSLAGRKRAHFHLNCGRCIVLVQKIVKIHHPKIRFCTKYLIFSFHFRHRGVILLAKPLRHPCGMPPPLVGEASTRHRPDALAVAAPPFLALLLGELARQRLRGFAFRST